MSGPSFERVQEVLADALERDASDRLQFVEAACDGDQALRDEVLDLLGHAEESEHLSTAPEVRMLWEEPATEETLQVVGAYHIKGLLGQGGMWPRGSALVQAMADDAIPLQWVNPFNRSEIDDAFRALIVRLMTQGIDIQRQCWGFKEIRYRLGGQFMAFWKVMFPDTRFLFLTRDPTSVVRSMFLRWKLPTLEAFDPEAVREYYEWATQEWIRAHQAIAAWHKDPQINSHLLRYESVESAPQQAAERGRALNARSR